MNISLSPGGLQPERLAELELAVISDHPTQPKMNPSPRRSTAGNSVTPISHLRNILNDALDIFEDEVSCGILYPVMDTF